MQSQYIDLKKIVIFGALTGIAWGWLAMAVNIVTGVFAFENALLHNLTAFAIGGAVFGIVASGFLSLLQGWLPFKSNLTKAVYIAVSLWIILFIGGYGLATVEPDRFVFEYHQGIQGLALALVLGAMLGYFWKRFDESC